MRSILVLTSLLLLTSSSFAQNGFFGKQSSTPNEEEIEVIIVRSSDECEQAESAIYEIYEGEQVKVAFLYPDVLEYDVATNRYNKEMISSVLTDYHKEGFEISDTYTKDYSGKCGRKIAYKMTRPANYAYLD